jgi:hypothetical protein
VKSRAFRRTFSLLSDLINGQVAKENSLRMPLPAAVLVSLCVVAAASLGWAMGPDPGGHTGATVTPETTRTDRPAVDAARQSTSGGRTETSGPAASSTERKK